MPLSWNEIRNRTYVFAKRWEHDTSENAEAKPFWIEFLNVFGIDRKRVASFEDPVKKLGNKQGFIDLFWKGMLLIEHKSRGMDLNKAYSQALDYFPGIKDRDLPKYVLVSDFARFRLYDLEDGTHNEFELRELHKNLKLFGFIAGYQTKPIKPEDPVNIKAALLMGKLHDALNQVRLIDPTKNVRGVGQGERRKLLSLHHRLSSSLDSANSRSAAFDLFSNRIPTGLSIEDRQITKTCGHIEML